MAPFYPIHFVEKLKYGINIKEMGLMSDRIDMSLTETDNREYKRQISDGVEKTVIGFLNSSGGELFIGIDDDGSVHGVENYDEVVRSFTDRIKNNISPSALGLFSVSPKKDEKDKIYIEIRIASGFEKPYYVSRYGMSPKGCFIRVGTQTLPMTQAMIDTLYSRRSLHTLHNVVSPNQHLTFEQLKIYYNEKGFSVGNDNFLRNLDLYTEDGKFNYLAYLMADNNGVSIKIAQYSGTDKITILKKTECGHCSLIKATYSMLTALDIYNQTAVEITYPKRIETRLVEPIALRESVLNAILHNDYIRGAYPVVEFYSDRVEITSSGGLPLGLTREEFFEGRSLPRNRELMRIFSNMDLCEQLGSGMKRIMGSYKPEDYSISDNFIVADFKYNEHALAVLKGEKGSEKGSEKFAKISPTKKRIIEMISEDNSVTADRMATAIGVSTRAIEKNIKQLKDMGMIERRDGDRGGYWEILKQ